MGADSVSVVAGEEEIAAQDQEPDPERDAKWAARHAGAEQRPTDSTQYAACHELKDEPAACTY